MATHPKPESGEAVGWYELSHMESTTTSPRRPSTHHAPKRNQTSWTSKLLQRIGIRGGTFTPTEGRRIPLRLRDPGQLSLVDNRTGQPYMSNRIRTSRYTAWNFLPRQLLYQFSRLANAYFLIIAILQMIPGFSTTGRFTTIIPLMVFVCLTMAKEGYDDFRRYRLDKAENNRKAKILRPGGRGSGGQADDEKTRPSQGSMSDILLEQRRAEDRMPADCHWVTTRWGDLQVGDIVRLVDYDQVPADIILLSAENTIAYVDTRALDGETTLKSKFVSTAFKHLRLGQAQDVEDANIALEVEQPNQDLYSFDGTVTTGGADSLPLTLDNIIYRGCEVRNTRALVGVIINTGEDTKIRMNANKDPPEKRPALEKFVNMVVVVLAVYMIVTSALLYMGFRLYWQTTSSIWYMMGEVVPDADVIIGFIIQFSNVVPMSLIMAVEAVKLNLAYLVNSDLDIYHEESDCPANCNTNVILDDLGQIDYVFSDKTGTLTDNIMKLRRISVAGASWFHRDRGTPSEDKALASPGEMTTEDLVDFVRGNPSLPSASASADYILGMALCHTCIPDIDPSDGTVVDFQASSPDELALVRGARELGILVTDRSTNSITLEFQDGYLADLGRQTYEILDVIEFSSKRKRMSVIVRRPDGRIWLICKGADTLVLPRLKIAGQYSPFRPVSQQDQTQQRRPPTSLSYGRRSREFIPDVVPHSPLSPILGLNSPDRDSYARQPSPLGDTSAYRVGERTYSQPTSPLPPADEVQDLKQCLAHIDGYAREGLRTLVFAHRLVPEDEYAAWKREYREAQLSLESRADKVERVGEKIEKPLSLLGASGVEDKLQKGVPETITRLRRAGIKIWMLTGDKRETAINIAHSSQICTSETSLFQLDSEQGDLPWQISDIVASIERQPLSHIALVVDGQTLTAFDHPSLAAARETLFRVLIPQIHSVICCRASPSQKALLVSAVRDETPPPEGTGFLGRVWWWTKSSARSHLRPRTLAIGDGANDLAMITAANVGVGLSGREGQQAARVADVSIAQFRFLAKLLLVHGRWNYHRITRFVLGSFWKETLFWFPAALYQIAAGFTGTSIYESTALTVYGVAFTILCTVSIGAFEKDLHARTLMAVPELYAYGQRAQGLNWGVFAGWIANAVLTGSVMSFVAWAGYGGAFLTTPDDNGLYALGTLVFISCMIWTNVKILLLEMRYKTAIILLVFATVFSLLWIFHLIVGYIFTDIVISPYAVVGGFIDGFGRDVAWWATLALILVCLATVEISVATVRQYMAGRRSRTSETPLAEMGSRVWKELESEPRLKRQLQEVYEAEI